MNDKQPPVVSLRLNGLKASVWQNETDNGVMFNTTFVRTYRDDDGEYHDTNTFGERHLPTLASLANMALTRINELRQAEQSQDDRPVDKKPSGSSSAPSRKKATAKQRTR